MRRGGLYRTGQGAGNFLAVLAKAACLWGEPGSVVVVLAP